MSGSGFGGGEEYLFWLNGFEDINTFSFYLPFMNYLMYLIFLFYF
jgi:hypothetical protein